MLCPKCGKEIRDGVGFCTSCGEKIAAEPAAEQEVLQQNPYQPDNTFVPPAQQAGWYVPVQPVPPVPPMAAPVTPASDAEKKPREEKPRFIAKSGYVVSLILSTLLLGLNLFLSVSMLDALDNIESPSPATYYICLLYFARLLFCFFPFFFFCIRMRKKPAYYTAFALIIIVVDKLIVLFSSIFQIPVFGLQYEFSWSGTLVILLMLAGIVTYAIVLSSKKKMFELKIISAILLGFVALPTIISNEYTQMTNLELTRGVAVGNFFGYSLSLMVLFAAMIVILFTVKKEETAD